MKLQKFLALVQPILKLVIGFFLNLKDYCVYMFDEITYKLLETVSTLLVQMCHLGDSILIAC